MNFVEYHHRFPKYLLCVSSPQTAMSRDRDNGRPSSPWSSYAQQSQNASGGQTHLSVSTESNQSQGRGMFSAPATSSPRIPVRPDIPTRSSTIGTSDPSRSPNTTTLAYTQSRSEDYNHQSSSSNQGLFSSPRPSPSPHSSASRPNTPAQPKDPSFSGHSDNTSYSESSSNSKPPPFSSNSPSAALVAT